MNQKWCGENAAQITFPPKADSFHFDISLMPCNSLEKKNSAHDHMTLCRPSLFTHLPHTCSRRSICCWGLGCGAYTRVVSSRSRNLDNKTTPSPTGANISNVFSTFPVAGFNPSRELGDWPGRQSRWWSHGSMASVSIVVFPLLRFLLRLLSATANSSGLILRQLN